MRNNKFKNFKGLNMSSLETTTRLVKIFQIFATLLPFAFLLTHKILKRMVTAYPTYLIYLGIIVLSFFVLKKWKDINKIHKLDIYQNFITMLAIIVIAITSNFSGVISDIGCIFTTIIAFTFIILIDYFGRYNKDYSYYKNMRISCGANIIGIAISLIQVKYYSNRITTILVSIIIIMYLIYYISTNRKKVNIWLFPILGFWFPLVLLWVQVTSNFDVLKIFNMIILTGIFIWLINGFKNSKGDLEQQGWVINLLNLLLIVSIVPIVMLKDIVIIVGFIIMGVYVGTPTYV